MNAIRFEPTPPKWAGYRNGSSGMSRLVNAALVDPEFCKLLLSQPDVALSRGFQQDTFSLSSQERHFVLTTQAASLVDFAAQWVGRGECTVVRSGIPSMQIILSSENQG